MNLSNKQALTQIAEEVLDKLEEVSTSAQLWLVTPSVLTMDSLGSMPFCVELDNLKDTDAPIHQPAAMLVAAD